MVAKGTVGIILAGGKGTRLAPLTCSISKQLLPVYNKPMIHYPLETLISLGISRILIIVADSIQLRLFQQHFSSIDLPSDIELSFAVQENAGGLPQAFIIGEKFIGHNNVVLILGDNVFITDSSFANTELSVNTIFSYKVKNPSAYGVAVIKDERLIDIVEKPLTYVSDDAIVGLYYFSPLAVDIAKNLTPSSRGEVEIVDLIKALDNYSGSVSVKELDGFWFDCGTHDDLLDCANLVRAIEHRTRRTVGIR